MIKNRKYDNITYIFRILTCDIIIVMEVENPSARRYHMGHYDDFDLDIKKVRKANGVAIGVPDAPTTVVCSLITFEYCTDGTPVCTSEIASGRTQECSASDMTACRGGARC